MGYEYLSKKTPEQAGSVSSQSSVSFKDNRTSQLKVNKLAASLNPEVVQCAVDEEEELVQAKAINPVQREKNSTGLPDNLKSGMEQVSGMSLDHVKVHYNSSKPASVQAHAYAQGSDIHLASGQEKHLPHELGHVVQQAQGRVQPTTNVNGMQVNDNPALESEATKLGQSALQRASYGPSTESVKTQKKNL